MIAKKRAKIAISLPMIAMVGAMGALRGPLRPGTSPERCAEFCGQSLGDVLQWLPTLPIQRKKPPDGGIRGAMGGKNAKNPLIARHRAPFCVCGTLALATSKT